MHHDAHFGPRRTSSTASTGGRNVADYRNVYSSRAVPRRSGLRRLFLRVRSFGCFLHLSTCSCALVHLFFFEPFVFSRRDSPQPALFCASFCRFLFSAGSDAHSFEKNKPEVFWTQCPLQRRFLAVFSGLVFVGTHRLHIFIFTFRMRLTVSSAAVMYWGFFFLSLFSSS